MHLPGGKRVAISEGMKAKGPTTGRRIYRSVVPAVLVVGVVLPFLFIRSAFLALDGSGVCSSINCIGWRLGPGLFVGGGDASMRLANELTRALLEAKEAEKAGGVGLGAGRDDGSPETFEELVAEAASKKLDIRSFVSKTTSLMTNMDRKMRQMRKQRSVYRHLASIGVPNCLHCLCLRLAEEYSINSLARISLPSPEYVSRLTDRSYHHVVILSDNVLAAGVVVASAMRSSNEQERMIFHIVTDKKTYAPMHAWFALNPVWPVMVEVKGLHQYDWPVGVNAGVMEMMELHLAIREHYYTHGRSSDVMGEGVDNGKLDALRPTTFSLLNHIRIYLPELFPELDKIVFLDDDVVIQKDLSPLWSLHLDGKVNGAVSSWSREGDQRSFCFGRTMRDYLNFTNPEILSSPLEVDQCAWLYGMNIFDLDAWRRTNITRVYHQWLKLNQDSGFKLWKIGALPPALISFADYVHPIDPSWHVSGLGEEVLDVNQEMLESASVLHYSGPAKPWLPIASPKLKSFWSIHVNYTNDLIKSCGIME